MRSIFKLAVTGTHSTGKSTFLTALEARLVGRGLRVGRVDNLAVRARALGFPILAGHTIESTLWIIAECLRQEAELSLTRDVILVDRPVLDAVGYLMAAIEVSGRSVDENRVARLLDIVRAHIGDYNLLIKTVLDPSIPLGDGRDTNEALRQAADRHIAELVAKFAPAAAYLESGQHDVIMDLAEGLATATVGQVQGPPELPAPTAP